MADNITIPATGSGDATPKVATDQDSGAPNAHYQLIKPVWGALDTFNITDTASGKALPIQIRSSTGEDVIKHEDDASASADPGIVALAIQKSSPADTAGTDGDYSPLQMSGGKLWTANIGNSVTITTSFTRPADTTTYTANDNMETSTSAPTTGGLTFTGAARISGGSGVITDLIVTSSADPALTLQAELWIFDSAVSANQNDNAAIALADPDVLLLVAVIPFTLASTVAGSGTNSYAHVQNLNIGFTCVGTANLRFKVKCKNAYIPISAEVFQFRLKIIQTN